MPTSSIQIGADLRPLIEQIGALRTEIAITREREHWMREAIVGLRTGQDELNGRINSAILWLAVAASAVVFGLIWQKLGLSG
jgi:hypothetical protein